GLGHRPFTAVTGVRIPLGSPLDSSENKDLAEMLGPFFRLDLYYCGIKRHNLISICPIYVQKNDRIMASINSLDPDLW
ncbi:MAG: hypothetical protein VW778_09545, partial [Betaproteobacteria bacterium]